MNIENSFDLLTLITMIIGCDFLIGDPHSKFHPISILGKLISKSESFCRRRFANEYIAGICCVLIVLTIILFSNILLITILHKNLTYLYTIFIGWSCLAIRSLIEHGNKVNEELRKDNISGAKRAVSMLISRTTEQMKAKDIIRATIESLSENFIDSIVSPIFWFMLGYYFGGIKLATSLMITLRVINTFDAMIGYKNERYLKFGFFAAKFDDILHFIPARITPIIIAIGAFIVKLDYKNALKYGYKDGDKHPSLNSCYAMASFAGALGILLGGPTAYQDEVKNYAFWGIAKNELQTSTIKKCIQLILSSTLALVIILTIIFIIFR
ncbi:adenosylcobinamide-phosphate synthase CbiB [Lentisphaerota bacterium WC36G]|nr:adenosylcobinamide-phosphate synthase CbiB [Lentisphaerae bacterium WC36]